LEESAGITGEGVVVIVDQGQVAVSDSVDLILYWCWLMLLRRRREKREREKKRRRRRREERREKREERRREKKKKVETNQDPLPRVDVETTRVLVVRSVSVVLSLPLAVSDRLWINSLAPRWCFCLLLLR